MNEFWTDFEGNRWRVITSARRLKFKYPGHAALRRHIFNRDNYTCVRCSARAINVPACYDGRSTLFTSSVLESGWPDMLILDHVVTLKAGGRNRIDNFQTLCETCNRKKIKEDVAAARSYREAA